MSAMIFKKNYLSVFFQGAVFLTFGLCPNLAGVNSRKPFLYILIVQGLGSDTDIELETETVQEEGREQETETQTEKESQRERKETETPTESENVKVKGQRQSLTPRKGN
jgi:hypothetical protein